MIGSYDIRGTLGKGAMGAVYRGWDPRRERLVAIKVLVPGSDESRRAEEITRFLREGDISRSLKHPNIVEVYDVGHDAESGMPYIVMEFIKGKPLHALLKERHLTILESVNLICKVAEGLDYAAQAAVIHRDIKPANILVDPVSLTPKLVDFGVARIEGTNATHSGTVLGTPHYMSPEQCRSDAVDGRSDLFSLGAVLYEMLTTEKAFPGDTIMNVMMAVLDPNKPAPPAQLRPQIPPALSDAVMKALAKDSAARFQRGREMANALRAALADTPEACGTRPAEHPPAEQTVILPPHIMARFTSGRNRSFRKVTRLSLVIGLASLVALPLGIWVSQQSSRSTTQTITPTVPPAGAGRDGLSPNVSEPALPASVVTLPDEPLPLRLTFAAVKESRGVTTLMEDGQGLLPYENFAVVANAEETIYLYIWQTDSSGRVFRLFPNVGLNPQGNPVPAHRLVWLPSLKNKKQWFHLDFSPGEEEIVMVASARPLPELEEPLGILPASGVADPTTNRNILRDLDRIQAKLSKASDVSKIKLAARHSRSPSFAWALKGNANGFYHQLRLKHLS
jgi:serine/threonine protein kinase